MVWVVELSDWLSGTPSKVVPSAKSSPALRTSNTRPVLGESSAFAPGGERRLRPRCAHIQLGIEPLARIEQRRQGVGLEPPEVEVDAAIGRVVDRPFVVVLLVIDESGRKRPREQHLPAPQPGLKPGGHGHREVALRLGRIVEDVVIDAEVRNREGRADADRAEAEGHRLERIGRARRLRIRNCRTDAQNRQNTDARKCAQLQLRPLSPVPKRQTDPNSP